MVKKVVAVVKRQTRNLVFLHLLREYQVLKYFCSYMVDDASVSELEDHEIELLFIQHLERDKPSSLIAPDQQS
jgi:heat shock protein HspQ